LQFWHTGTVPRRLSRRAAIAKRIAPTANQANSYPSYVTANYAYTAEKIGTVLSRDETTFTPGCADRRDKSAVSRAKQNVSVKPQRIVANAPHFEEVQVKQSHAVSTVSFQAHAFSDGESIHLKLPGGLVSISSDAQQPSGHPYLHARARAPFRIKPEAAG